MKWYDFRKNKRCLTTALLYEVLSIFLVIIVILGGVYYFTTRLSLEYISMQFLATDITITLEELSIMPSGYSLDYYFNLTKYDLDIKKSKYNKERCILQLKSLESDRKAKVGFDCGDVEYIVKLRKNKVNSMVRFSKITKNKIIITNEALEDIAKDFGFFCDVPEFKQLVIYKIKNSSLKTNLISLCNEKNINCIDSVSYLDNVDLVLFLTDDDSIFYDSEYKDYIRGEYDLYVIQNPSKDMGFSNSVICRLKNRLKVYYSIEQICENNDFEFNSVFKICSKQKKYSFITENLGYNNVVDMYKDKDIMFVYITNTSYENLAKFVISIQKEGKEI